LTVETYIGRPVMVMPNTSPPSSPHIVLYDGVCALCHQVVRFVLKRDRSRVFYFAPLQGETAAKLRQQYPQIPSGLNTMVYVEDGRVHLRSKGFLHAAIHLPYPWRIAGWFRWMPAFLTDPFYWIVAKTRYRLFGRFDSCQLPTDDERARFLP
jgi:predicted DCC family thiol-disulfide oxidoreductase YuxK